jgi:hypothetical protein
VRAQNEVRRWNQRKCPLASIPTHTAALRYVFQFGQAESLQIPNSLYVVLPRTEGDFSCNRPQSNGVAKC